LKAIRKALEHSLSEAISAKDAATLCSIGLASWHRLNAAKLIPRPVRLASSVRWLRSELLAWLQAGAPDRARWEVIKGARQK
jgi:predicted DNA-binding transcriptional regulator AlpA